MAVHFAVEELKFDLKEKMKIKKWVADTIKQYDKKMGDISYMFCDDAHLLKVNIEYLNHDTYTDIITFDYVEGDVISGDIIISIERVKENANIFNVSFEQELHRVIIHGIHHLLGQGDKSDEEATEMRRRENKSLAYYETL